MPHLSFWGVYGANEAVPGQGTYFSVDFSAGREFKSFQKKLQPPMHYAEGNGHW